MAVVGSLLLPTYAFADVATAQPDRVRIAYDAAMCCPSRSKLLAQIAERVTIAWFADETEFARQIHVVLEPEGGGFVGRMAYIDESGRRVSRSLLAPDCEQAMAGIALVTAVAIESQVAQPTTPNAASHEGPLAAQPVPTKKDLDTASQKDARSPARPAEDPERLTSTPTSRPVEADSPPVTSRPTNAVTQEVGLLAGAVYGVGPGAALGGGASWGIGRTPFPLLRMVANWYEYRQEVTATATTTTATRFRVISLGPQLCGRQPVPGIPNLVAGPCAGVELGQYLAEGKPSDPALYETYTYRLFWASAQLSVPLRWALGGAFVELQPAVRFPLVVGAFVLKSPDQTVHRIPRVAPSLNIALGFTFQ